VSSLSAFVALEVTLCLIPGPAVLLTVSYALRRGVRAGLAAACGVVAGNTLYFALSGAGIVALLFASYRIFTLLKWAGAAYLAVLGLRALFARRQMAPDSSPGRVGERSRAFVSGFATQVANPKAIVFFIAVLPQFIDPRASLGPQLAILTLASTIVEFTVLTGYSLAAARLRRSVAAERASLWVERAGGGVLLWIASRIAFEPGLLSR
jgi:homoserine/homoserine lactone efflux protein